MMFVLFLLAWVIKYFDSFVLRTDELIGEAILTKLLGFVLVAVYVWGSGRTLRSIGFHEENLIRVLLIAVLGFGGLYGLAYGGQLLLLKLTGEEAALALAAVDPKTGLAGGLAFGLWLVAANLVNSAMEEGLFRGAMIRHFLLRLSGRGAILLQAALFAVWHLSWPARHLLDGEATLGEAAFEAFGLLLAAFISGVAYGYFYFRTNSIWGPFVAHTINNSIFNVLFIRTNLGTQSSLDFAPFTVVFLVGHLAMIPVIGLAAKRLKTPGVRSWAHQVSSEG